MLNTCQICDFSFGRCGIKLEDLNPLVEAHAAISFAQPAYALNQTALNDVDAP